MENTDVKDRVLAFLQSEGLSSAQFAQEVGVQPSSISHIISGRNKPSLDFVTKMLSRYPHLRADWLLFGKGSMLKANDQTAEMPQELPLFRSEGYEEPAKAHPGLQSAESSPSAKASSEIKDEVVNKLNDSEERLTYGNKEKPEQIILVYSGNRFRILDAYKD